MMQTLVSSITYLDFFGSNLSLLKNSSTMYKTFFGGIVNLFIIFVGVIMFFLLGRELWERKNPITNTSTENNPEPNSIKYFKDIQFTLGIRSKVDYSIFMNMSIYTVQSYLFVYDTQEKMLKSYPLKTEECTEDSFDENHLALFEKFSYKSFWCISRNQSANFTIELSKLYGQDNFKMISTRILPCNNKTFMNKCGTKEDIEMHLDGTFISINAINNNVQSKEYYQPFEKIVENYFSSISTWLTTDVTIFVREVKFITDSSLFFEENTEINGFIHESPQISYFKDDTYFFALTWELLNKKNEIKRSYYKFQSLIAQIGGLVNSLILISRALLLFYNQHYLHICLINDLFSFNLKYHNGGSINPGSVKIASKSHQNSQCVMMNKISMTKQVGEFGKFRQSQRFEYSFLEKTGVILLCKGKYTEKHQAYLKSLKYVHKHLDVSNVIQLWFEIDKLKYLILEPNQRKLFEILQKPTIAKCSTITEDCYEAYNNYLLRSKEFLDKTKTQALISEIEKINYGKMNERLISLAQY